MSEKFSYDPMPMQLHAFDCEMKDCKCPAISHCGAPLNVGLDPLWPPAQIEPAYNGVSLYSFLPPPSLPEHELTWGPNLVIACPQCRAEQSEHLPIQVGNEYRCACGYEWRLKKSPPALMITDYGDGPAVYSVEAGLFTETR
jgi:hypothetical protein